jgi:hypothetical protein
MEIQIWPIDKLVFYARNPRKNDAAVDRMCGSIREFGFKIPCLVRSDGEVIDGHLRLKAARKLGIADIPVILCDEWSPAQVKAFRLMVNRSAAWAEWDEELLAIELMDLKTSDYDLSLTGFDTKEIDAFILNDAPDENPGTSACYYAINTAATASDVITVSATPSVPAGSELVYISEFSRIAASSPVDTTAAATGNSTNPSSGSATTSNANDLIFGFRFVPGTATSGSGVTSIDTTSGNNDEYEKVATMGSYSATFTGSSQQWVAQMVAFKANTSWTAVSTDGINTCGVNNGKLYCWGSNSYGEVGNAGTQNTIFVTTATYTGDIGGGSGGLAAADTICSAAASGASLSGSYLPWLTTATALSPLNTFTKSLLPYKDTQGNTIASNWSALVGTGTANLTNGINI